MDLSVGILVVLLAMQLHWEKLHEKKPPKSKEEKLGEAIADYLSQGLKVRVEGFDKK